LRALAGLDGVVDRLVELREAGRGRLDRAVAPVMLSNSVLASLAALVICAASCRRRRRASGGRGDGLLGAVGLGVVRQVAPRGVELAHQRVDAGGRRLADRALHAIGASAVSSVAQRHALRADLEVQEGVADAGRP
jgi:hypothetical protein